MKHLYIFLISMVPLIELRGAIPVGAGFGLDFFSNYTVSVIGNMLPVPFILLMVRFVLSFMREKRIFPSLVDWLEKKALSGSKRFKRGVDGEEAEQDASEEQKPRLGAGAAIGLFLFVAIPLPGTGAWTGALIASLFGMRRVTAFFSILLGVLTAGLLMSLASYGIVGALSFFV